MLVARLMHEWNNNSLNLNFAELYEHIFFISFDWCLVYDELCMYQVLLYPDVRGIAIVVYTILSLGYTVAHFLLCSWSCLTFTGYASILWKECKYDIGEPRRERECYSQECLCLALPFHNRIVKINFLSTQYFIFRPLHVLSNV